MHVKLCLALGQQKEL